MSKVHYTQGAEVICKRVPSWAKKTRNIELVTCNTCLKILEEKIKSTKSRGSKSQAVRK